MSQDLDNHSKSKSLNTGQKAGNFNNGEGACAKKEQNLGTSRQQESSTVVELRKKWDDDARRGCAEIALALPGGKPEGYANREQVDYVGNTEESPYPHGQRTTEVMSQTLYQSSHPLALERQKLQESVQNARQNTSTKGALTFNLFTGIDAESVVLVAADNQTIELKPALPKSKRYWINYQPLLVSEDQTSFRYHYSASFKKNILKRALLWIARRGENSLQQISEKNSRKCKDGSHIYDIFSFPYSKETNSHVFDGYLYFVKMLYGEGIDRGVEFRPVLEDCQSLPFDLMTISVDESKKFLRWLEQATSSCKNCFQAAYICSILGQVVKQSRSHHTIFGGVSCPFPRQTADSLLILLSQCSCNQIPGHCLQMIESVAAKLVQASSCKGWFSFLRFFANLFTVDNLLDTARSLSARYKEDDFLTLTEHLINRFETLPDRHNSIREISEFVIGKCEFIPCLRHLFDVLTVRWPDVAKTLRPIFLERFRELISFDTGAQRIDLLQRNFWELTPMEMRVELADPFVDALKEHVTNERLDDEKATVLKNYATDKDIGACKQFHSFVCVLARNQNTVVYMSVLDLLNSETFFAAWRAWTNNEKSEVCVSLFDTTWHVKEPLSQKAEPRLKVIKVLTTQKNICETAALKNDQEMQLALENHAIQLLTNVTVTAIIDAFGDVDMSSQIMQSCYSSLVRDVTKRGATTTDGSRVKRVLDQLKRSAGEKGRHQGIAFKGARKEFLMYLLELIELPTNLGGHVDFEVVLNQMMEMDDVWSFILGILQANRELENHPKVKIVIDALKIFENLIELHKSRVGYLLELKESNINVLAHFCNLLDSSVRNPTGGTDEKDWKENIRTDWKRACDFQEIFQKMERSIRFVVDVVGGIAVVNDEPELVREINKRKNFSQRSLNEVVDGSYWGSLLSLVDAAEALNKLHHSLIFLNIARAFLEDEKLGLRTNAESYSASHIMEMLSTKGIERLQRAFFPLFSKNSDLPIEDLHILLCGIEDLDVLHKELSVISNYFRRHSFPESMEKMLISYLRYPALLGKAQQLLATLEVFGYGNTPVTLKEFVESPNLKQMTLKGLCDTMESEIMTQVDCDLNKDLTNIITILGKSRELVSFIEETVNEDMVVLIDVVEEYSDQFVTETTVLHLIDVHRFLKSIVKDKPPDPIKLLRRLRNCFENLQAQRGMAAKIDECSRNVYSLRGFYTNVADRGEMTKEIISNALRGGSYQLGRNDAGSWEVLLAYKKERKNPQEKGVETKYDSKNDQRRTYKLSDLLDLRSRALLLVNIDSKYHRVETSPNICTECSAADLKQFVKQVDQIMEIINLAKALHMSGHPDYKKFWVKLDSSPKIEEEARTLTHKLQSWNDILEKMYDEYFFLNYFHPDQLWILSDYFAKCQKSDGSRTSQQNKVHDLLRFIQPSLQSEALDKISSHYDSPIKNRSVEADMSALGRAFDCFFLSLAQFEIPEVPLHFFQGTVKPGELFIATLEQGSTQTVHVVMSLFERMTGTYPEPSQVIFCHSDTSWEEIRRLLRRSFGGYKHTKRTKLYCLANVESLPNDMQFNLVSAIRHFQSVSDTQYLLSLVCRGGAHHHIADQFATGVHNVTGMTDVKLRAKFKETFPRVFVVTSELPGLGKTETIFREAGRCGKGIVTLPISGPLCRRNLVHQMASLHIKECECIHLDIGEVDDPVALDTFLFELLVVGMVSSGTLVYHLPREQIYIEIANTLKNWLHDSLPVTKCFNSIHVKFDEYEHYVVSQESSSPLQVVCNYLDAFEKGTLESRELTFKGPNKVKPLTALRCRSLLRKYFSSAEHISYNIVETFLRVFADQLLKFSESPFLKPVNLRAMLKEDESNDVRTRFFRALLQVSMEFAVRSVVACKTVQAEAISDKQASGMLKQVQLSSYKSSEKVVQRMEGMIQWADNNHLLLIFQTQRALTISAFYRQLSLVPGSVKHLCELQGMKLVNYESLSQEQLQEKLDLLAKDIAKATHNGSSLKYALTPDNVLKMILILLRIRANIPVILMGETGCGKTSLVRYLARTCDVPFRVFNVHAGVSKDQITSFVREVAKCAVSAGMKKRPLWVFLDEINTCDYLGTVNEIMCHHTIRGKPLPSNLVFIAACNPYRLRQGAILTSGLSEKIATDEYSKLVYRVHPLPETMIDYVWDYGSVSPEDEKRYIARMVEDVFNNKHRKLLVNLLFAAQNFIRDVESTPFCVSLRDVHRCIVLMNWFHSIQQRRIKLPQNKFPSHIMEYYKQTHGVPIEIRCLVLALAHCYQSRLQTEEKRAMFCKEMSILIKGEIGEDFLDESFQAVVRVEQEDFLARMELPAGTAKNAALRENVFVILVCILNRLPVFVVGKPGCSKSLSMQVIRSNLRGKDAKDPLLKQLPQLYVVSYQGSESSTSEGILKVFEKARKYKVEGSTDVLPVVLLDEIGLAEVSSFNPLKVLHNLLEPENEAFPDVAVVGISNWCLDPAKMNRAIHLSRPEPDITDLLETGQSIREAQLERRNTMYFHSFEISNTSKAFPDNYQLSCLANAYKEYQVSQKHENFHGLRDYYSLVKCLSSLPARDIVHQCERKETARTQRALQRNFGGIPADVNNIQHLFLKHFQSKKVQEEIQSFPVTELICDNLHDKFARHMMLITNGDSAIGILDETLGALGMEKVTIFGSRFEEDQSEEYNYNILSRIILCMERNCVLILRDLESIYGSLYDMLNQNYTVVGQKKNCRVALGPLSNSMCQVHDEFRCIVLIDEQRIDYTDPPFLNRFEKQLLRFSDVLSEDQRKVITCLESWTKDISTVHDLEAQFNETDMFMGLNKDTLPSLVLHISKNATIKKHKIVEKCKKKLMWIATPDGVLRSLKSQLSRKAVDEVDLLCRDYFARPVHNGLKGYLDHALKQEDKEKEGLKLLIMTHSNIHTNITQCVSGLGGCQAEKLSSFRSEKQLGKQLQSFWASNCKILVLQCKPDLDAPHMLVAKHLIEEQRNTYISAKPNSPAKHVCIVVHVQRLGKTKKTESPQWQFNFQSGWEQVAIDTLEEPMQPVMELLDAQLTDLLRTESFSFKEIANDQLWWCFTRIRYSSTHDSTLNAVRQLVNWLKSSSLVIECFEKIVLRFLEKEECTRGYDPFASSSWLVKVASDRLALVNSSTLVEAINHHFIYLVQQPLAKIVYFLEKESAWPKYVSDEAVSYHLYVWKDLLLNEGIFRIEDIPEPQGAESYFVPGHRHELECPFSSVFIRRVDKMKSLFLEDSRRLQLGEANLNDRNELTDDVFGAQLQRFEPEIHRLVEQLLSDGALRRIPQCYVDDFLDLWTASFAEILSRTDRINLSKAVVADHIRIPPKGNFARLITHLHCIFWMKESLLMSAFHLAVKCRGIAPAHIEPLTSQFARRFDEMMFDTQDASPTETYPISESSSLPQGGSQEDIVGDFESEDHEVQDPSPAATYPISESSSLPQGGSQEEFVADFESEDHAEGKASTFLEILDETVCRALFPTESINTCQDLRQWQRSVSLILSMVSRLQLSVSAFHFLRVCHDFVSLMISEDSEELFYSLYTIGEAGLGYASEGYLESSDCFDMISRQIASLEQKGKDLHHLKRFEAIFYTRCIESNLDTPVRKCILSRISSSNDKTLIKLAAPVVSKIFMDEDRICRETREAGVFEEFLINPFVLEDHPGLQDVHFALSFLTTETEPDFPFLVLCCDLISEIGFPSIDLAATSGSDSKCIKTLRRATEILSKPSTEEEKNVFPVVCAVAYLRSFLGSFARLTAKHPEILNEDSEFSMLVREVHSILSAEKNQFAAVKVLQLQLFFLRELRKEMSLYAVKQLVQDSKNLPALQALRCHTDDQILVCKLSFDPFSSITQNSSAKTALACLTHDENPNSEPMHLVLSDLQTSADQKIQLAAVLTRWIYLERSVRNLGESKEKAMECVNDGISSLPRPYVELLRCITGKKDFQAQELSISPTSSTEDVHRAALILHLCMVLASNYTGKKSEYVAFISYLVNPRGIKETFILGAANNPQYPFEVSQSDSSFKSRTSFNSCSCGTLFSLKEARERCGDFIACPECNRSNHSEVEQALDRRKSKMCLATKGYILLSPSENVSCCVRNLNPTEFRVLHLFLHVALYGGLALGLCDAETFSESIVDNAGGGCTVEVFYQHIVKDLAVLSKLFNRKEEEVIKFLHHVLEEVAPNILRANHCLTEKKRLLWEKEFSEAIRPLACRFGMQRKITNPHDSDSLSQMEKQIEEFDNPQAMDSLFRATSSKSFESLRSYYIHAEENVRESHPLLGLFFNFHDSLELVTNLNDLLVWTRMVDTQLSRRKSRKEASKTHIEDLLSDESFSKIEKEAFENAFKKFTISWTKIRPSVMKAGESDMPYITKMTPISLCLVEEKDDGKYLCSALRILQGIQNELILNVLAIAASGKCDALRLLERGEGTASVPMVHLQDAQKKEIIHYQWSNEILIHSQHNTEYGQGQEIFYDFGRIEKELAVRFLLEKCYLSTADGLREFMFAKELFHACKGILDELEQIVPQQPLTKEVQTGLRTLKNVGLKGVQDLLGHMEIVLCLLKKHQFGNPSEPLVDFTDRWLAESRPFPESLLPKPRKAVLLMHVVSLYEFLEDLLADSATDGIHDIYREEFPSDIRDQMLGIAGNCIAGSDKIPLASVTTALKRFIFRYVSSEEMRPDPGLPLLEHMLEQSLWPMEIMTERKGLSGEQWKDAVKSVLPEVLTLGQIHAALSLYQNQLKISEERKQPARNRTARRPTMSRSQRTRAGMGVSYS